MANSSNVSSSCLVATGVRLFLRRKIGKQNRYTRKATPIHKITVKTDINTNISTSRLPKSMGSRESSSNCCRSTRGISTRRLYWKTFIGSRVNCFGQVKLRVRLKVKTSEPWLNVSRPREMPLTRHSLVSSVQSPAMEILVGFEIIWVSGAWPRQRVVTGNST